MFCQVGVVEKKKVATNMRMLDESTRKGGPKRTANALFAAYLNLGVTSHQRKDIASSYYLQLGKCHETCSLLSHGYAEVVTDPLKLGHFSAAAPLMIKRPPGPPSASRLMLESAVRDRFRLTAGYL